MTTADYLESLQNDLERAVTALDLEEGTNFTNIADMAENGDISTGSGADLSEYFITEWNANTSSSSKINLTPKKYPDITIANNVTTLSYALSGLGGILPKLIFSSNVTRCDYLYRNSTAYYIDMSLWNITNITNFSNMCNSCQYLTSVVPPTTTNTVSDCNVSYMFSGCSGFVTLDLSGLKIDKASNLSYMFRQCTNLTSLDIRNIKLNPSGNSKNLTAMFYRCSALIHLDIRGMDFANVQINDTSDMFTDVPTSCEIIVKDTANKIWFANNFSSYKNVKTVAEYEAE